MVTTATIATTASTTGSTTATTTGSKQQSRHTRNTGSMAGISSGTWEVLVVQLRAEVDVQSTTLVHAVGLQRTKEEHYNQIVQATKLQHESTSK